jgi:4-hydroxy-2-oxoheptanedioate aldolase
MSERASGADAAHRTAPRLGTFVKLPAIESVELMALAGFDHVVIDLEHSPLSIETAATLISVARGRGVAPYVRIPSHGIEWVQRALDAGAAGILVPHVDTDEQGAAIARAASFGEGGTRGLGPTTRAGDWGLSPVAAYLAAADASVVVAQIESPAAVEAAAAIAASGVDALFVGPADLGQAMAVAPDAPELAEACARVLAAAQAAGVPCGIATGDGAAAAERLAQGFAFVVVGNDLTMLGRAAAAQVGAAQARA